MAKTLCAVPLPLRRALLVLWCVLPDLCLRLPLRLLLGMLLPPRLFAVSFKYMFLQRELDRIKRHVALVHALSTLFAFAY